MKIDAKIKQTLEKKLVNLYAEDIEQVYHYIDFLVFNRKLNSKNENNMQNPENYINSVFDKFSGCATHIWQHQDAQNYINNIRDNDRF
jgi:hypothetical protein